MIKGALIFFAGCIVGYSKAASENEAVVETAQNLKTYLENLFPKNQADTDPEVKTEGESDNDG